MKGQDCLLGNHFHFLVRIKNEEVTEENAITGKRKISDPINQIAKFFNSYAQSINKAYSRTGSLFEHPFKREEVNNDVYFTRLITYIHFNPQNHGFVDDFRQWPYFSYHLHLDDQTTFVNRNAVLE